MQKLFLPLCVVFILSCISRHSIPYAKIEGLMQGTTYRIVYRSYAMENISAAIGSILYSIDTTFSVYNPSSVVSRLNRNEYSSAFPAVFLDLLQEALRISQQSHGYFDITVAPLVQAYGFVPGEKKIPDSSRLDSLRQIVGYKNIVICENKVIKAHDKVQLDFNAIAQGYTVDVICDYLDSRGIKDYLVEVGGELRTKGKNPQGHAWKIGIDRPKENSIAGEDLQAVISLSGKALATSGNYRKFYVEDGIKYSHTINPLTGYPAKNTLLSATVITDRCAMADAWATAFMAMGMDSTLAFLKRMKNMQAYLIYSVAGDSMRSFVSEGLDTLLVEQ